MSDMMDRTDEEPAAPMSFDQLSPEDQKMLINNMMEGKPQTPQNMNKARDILMSDPDTVEAMCEKLGIDCSKDRSTDDEEEE